MDYEKMISKINILEVNLDRSTKRMVQANEHINDITNKNKELKEKNEHLNEGIDFMTKACDSYEKACSIFEIEIERLKKENNAIKQDKDSYLMQLELMQAGIDRTAQDMEHLKQFKIKFLMQENPGYSFYNEHDPIPSSEIGKDIILIDDRCVITRIIKKYNSNGSQSTIVFNNDD
jgi:uncharacterized phage infection (PIP) family protein YhgE